MSVAKTLEKLLRGESDANIRFDELCHLLRIQRFSDACFWKPSHFHASGSHGENQPATRRLEGEALSGSTSPQDSGNLQTVMKENSYEMIIWWSAEDNAFIVNVPELPGCMAHGVTRLQAIKNAEDAIAFWIKTAKADGLWIPEPKGRLLFA